MAGTDNAGRRCGVEMEFAGLTPEGAAEVVSRALGGTVHRTDTHCYEVRDGKLGKVKIELDTALAKTPEDPGFLGKLLDEMGAREDAARLLADVVPVPIEIVTEPLTRDAFDILETAIAALREAGALGTKGETLYAFGMHLNPEHRGTADEAMRIAAAYAFAEEWMRRTVPIDDARRVVPFVDPYPGSYVAQLAAAYKAGGLPLGEFIALYGSKNPDRNRGLDLWPLLGHLDADTAERHHRGPLKGARPAFHWRLPDSLIDDPDWTPRIDLDRWEALERAAADPDRFEALRLAAAERARGALARRSYLTRIDEVFA